MESPKDEQKVTSSDIEALNATQVLRHSSRVTPLAASPPLWKELQKVVSCSMMLSKAQCFEGLTKREEAVVVAAAALAAGNQLLWEDACASEGLEWESRSGNSLRQRVIEEALLICIHSRLEDISCGLVDDYPFVMPLHILHRAGEHGQIRFLLTLCEKRVAVRTNRVIANLPWKVMELLRRRCRNKCQRFPANVGLVQFRDVLRWACIDGDEGKIKTIVNGSSGTQDSAIASVLISEGRIGLLEQLIDSGTFHLTATTVTVFINEGALILAHKVLKVTPIQRSRPIISFRSPELLNYSEVIGKLIHSISSECGIVAMNILMLVHQNDWLFRDISQLYFALKELIMADDLETSPLVNSENPMLLAVTASELCHQIRQMKLQYRSCFTTLSREFRAVAVMIQHQYMEYKDLKRVYTESCISGGCLFELLTWNTERYRDLLNNTVVMAVVQDLWSGGATISFRLSCVSPCTWYFDSCHTASQVFSAHQLFKPDVTQQSFFQFHCWKANGSLRFSVESFGIISLYISLCFAFVMYLQIMNQWEREGNNEETLERLGGFKDYGTFLTIVTASYSVFTLQKWAYKKFRGAVFHFAWKDLLDVTMLLCCLWIRILTAPSIYTPHEVADLTNRLEPTYALLLFCCSLRICSALLQFHSFAPVLRMVYIIVKDVSYLLVIFLLALVSFAVLFSPLFWKNGEYFGNFGLSARTLFQWSLGGIDYSVFEDRNELGSLLGSIWVVLSTIILLNILIAVLSSRYEQLSTQVTADYVSILYSSYRDTRYLAPYGALILAPAPFNLLMLPLLPLFLVLPKYTATLNFVFELISYQIMFVCGATIWIVYELVLSTLAYFLVSFRLLTHCDLRTVFWLLAWWFIGPIYLSGLALQSFAYFCRNCYQDCSQPAESQLPSEVLQPITRLVNTATTMHPAPCFVHMDDIRCLMSILPNSKTASLTVFSLPLKSILIETSHYNNLATRLYFSKSTLRSETALRILEIISRFKSFSGDHCERVNVSRLATFLKKFEGRTAMLKGLNVYFVQKALYMRAIERKNNTDLSLF